MIPAVSIGHKAKTIMIFCSKRWEFTVMTIPE
jgi:hypothetical protein